MSNNNFISSTLSNLSTVFKSQTLFTPTKCNVFVVSPSTWPFFRWLRYIRTKPIGIIENIQLNNFKVFETEQKRELFVYETNETSTQPLEERIRSALELNDIIDINNVDDLERVRNYEKNINLFIEGEWTNKYPNDIVECATMFYVLPDTILSWVNECSYLNKSVPFLDSLVNNFNKVELIIGGPKPKSVHGTRSHPIYLDLINLRVQKQLVDSKEYDMIYSMFKHLIPKKRKALRLRGKKSSN